jgi:hypothetical protein
MKNNDPRYAKACEKAVKMRTAEVPAKWADVLKATGLSHSQAEFAVLRVTEKRRMPATTENAKKLRAEGFSWGHISVILDTTEGAARRLFTEASGNESQGLRVGKGGRFYRREQLLYDGELKPVGTTIPKGEKPDAVKHAAAQRLLKLVKADPEAARRIAVRYGVSLPEGKLTPAQITSLILKQERKVTATKKATRAKKAVKAQA